MYSLDTSFSVVVPHEMCHSSKCWGEFKVRCPSLPAWILVLCQVASGLCFHLGLYAIFDMLTESPSCWAVVPETYRVAHFIYSSRYVL